MPRFRLSMRFETKPCNTSVGYQTESKHNNATDSWSPHRSLGGNEHKENVSHLLQSPRQCALSVCLEASLRQVCLPGYLVQQQLEGSPCATLGKPSTFRKGRKRGKGEARGEQKPTACIFPEPLEEETVPMSEHVCSSPQKGPST